MFTLPTLLSARLDMRCSSKHALAMDHAHYAQITFFSTLHEQQSLCCHVQALALLFLSVADGIT